MFKKTALLVLGGFHYLSINIIANICLSVNDIIFHFIRSSQVHISDWLPTFLQVRTFFGENNHILKNSTKLSWKGPRREYVNHVHDWERVRGLGGEGKGGTEEDGFFVAEIGRALEVV